MLGMKRLNANVNYCLTVANGLSNELFNLEIWPDVPPVLVLIKLMFVFSMYPHWLIVLSCDFMFFAGKSPIDFLFDFLEASEGSFGSFDVIDHRPRAGKGNRLNARHMTFD